MRACVAATKMTLPPVMASRPSRIGFVPATNMIANVVAPIKAVVPRSTSKRISASSALTIANGMAKPNNGWFATFS